MTVHVPRVCLHVCVCVCTLFHVLPCSWFLSFAALLMTSHYLGWLPTAGRTCSFLQISLSFFSSLSVYRCPCACNSICPPLYLFIPASVYIYYLVCICDHIVLSGEKCIFFVICRFVPLHIFFFFLRWRSPRFAAFSCPLSLSSLSTSLSLYLSLLSIPRALLSKQSGLYQDEPQPKQAKQKIWARKSARKRGRILSCQPLCASLPTGDAPRTADPSLQTHSHTHTKCWHPGTPHPGSCMAFCKGAGT